MPRELPDDLAELSDDDLLYTLRCAYNWLQERSGRDGYSADDIGGRILRWGRDHPDDDDD